MTKVFGQAANYRKMTIAWNLGAQARIDGLSKKDNPYNSGDVSQRGCYDSWKDGYRYTHHKWGIANPNARPLPEPEKV